MMRNTETTRDIIKTAASIEVTLAAIAGLVGLGATGPFGPAAFWPAASGTLAALNATVLYFHRKQLSEREGMKAAARERKKVAFAASSLGSVLSESEALLAESRRALGRKSAMWRPLDRLVRAVRKLDKRLADDPKALQALSRPLRRRLPLIAETANRYAALTASADPDQSSRMRAAEGLLRRSADTITRLVTAPVEGHEFLRFDVDAEILGERIDADVNTLTANAAALHGAHHLQLLAPELDERMGKAFETAAECLGRIAELVERDAGSLAAATPFLQDDLPILLETADLYAGVLALTEDSEHDGVVSGSEKLYASLARLEDVERACIDRAVVTFDEKAGSLT